MSLAVELLDQAEMLVKREPKNPRQASLRRAVSAAYYALFHLLAEAAARQLAELCGRGDAGTISRLSRAFSHIDMKKVSDQFGSSTLPAALQRPDEQYQCPGDHKLVAGAFGSLYQARMEADYNTGEPATRAEAQKQIEKAKDAFAAWERVGGSADARTYLACFALWDNWNKKR